jgi:hypothetical protein
MVSTTHLVVSAGFHTSRLDFNTGYRVSDKNGFFYFFFSQLFITVLAMLLPLIKMAGAYMTP